MTETSRYSRPAIVLHWVTVPLMMFMLFVGQGYMHVPRGGSLAGFQPSTHVTAGILILLLSVARLSWRVGHRPPALPRTISRWQVTASHIVHWSIYALMIGVPLTGLLALGAFGAQHPDLGQVKFFGLVPATFMPNFGEWLGGVHGILFRVLKILVIVHILAALKHQFWDKDRTLHRIHPGHLLGSRRIGIGKSDRPAVDRLNIG
jgi:cytochrome b561